MRPTRATRILGIDPGSRLTGYGCIDVLGKELTHVTHGALKIASTSGKATVPLESRLLLIQQGLTEVIREWKPEIFVVEKVFFAKNALAALKLGQARGAAILTGMMEGLEFYEYSPTEVKQAVVGHGQADKDQVAKMVQLLIGQQKFVTSDASDALALAICHAHTARLKQGPAQVSAEIGRALQSASGRRGRKTQTLAESLGIRVGKHTT
ncbi:MAG: crossover junction endodeoxyribonuclease RuvC [Bdellovibrionota bacterium]